MHFTGRTLWKQEILLNFWKKRFCLLVIYNNRITLIQFLYIEKEVTGGNLIYNFSFLMLQSFHCFLSFPTYELRCCYKMTKLFSLLDVVIYTCNRIVKKKNQLGHA